MSNQQCQSTEGSKYAKYNKYARNTPEKKLKFKSAFFQSHTAFTCEHYDSLIHVDERHNDSDSLKAVSKFNFILEISFFRFQAKNETVLLTFIQHEEIQKTSLHLTKTMHFCC